MATLNDSTQNAVGELTNLAGNLSLPIAKTFADYIRSTINYATQKAEDSIASLDPARMSTGRMEEYKIRARNEFLAPFTQNLLGLGMQLLNFERAGEQWKAQQLLVREKWNFDKDAAEEEAARNRERWEWEKRQYNLSQSKPLSGIASDKSIGSGRAEFPETELFGGKGSFVRPPKNGGEFTLDDLESALAVKTGVGAGGRVPGSRAENDYIGAFTRPHFDFSSPIPRTTTPFQAPIKKAIKSSMNSMQKDTGWI